jgi:hypothetical protein
MKVFGSIMFGKFRGLSSEGNGYSHLSAAPANKTVQDY